MTGKRTLPHFGTRGHAGDRVSSVRAPQPDQDDLISAGSVLAILPPLLLFALVNRYRVRDLYAGAVKG